jgi:UbiD family decarboxylase
MEADGFLKRVTDPISTKHEIAAYIRKVSDTNGDALLFDNVTGYENFGVLGGLFATQRLIEYLLGASGKDRLIKYQNAIDHPIEPNLIHNPPCQEFIFTGDDVDLFELPNVTYHGKDSDPYITMGVEITRDCISGIRNAAIHRMQVKNKNTLGCQLGPYSHMGIQTKHARENGKMMEIAIAIGVSPYVILGSQARVPFDFDELSVAGGLAGEPIDIAKCITIDLEVPADSEIVVEGYYDPNVEEPEGIFAEYPGYYGPVPLTPVIHVTAITFRKNPIYLAGLSGKPHTENHLLRALPMETELFNFTRQVSENVEDVILVPGGATFMSAISMTNTRVHESRQVLMAALASRARCKTVVAVNADINIKDASDILWAINTRSQPDRDMIILKDMPVCELDPSGIDGGTSAIGIDATIPFNTVFEEPAFIPGLDAVKI